MEVPKLKEGPAMGGVNWSWGQQQQQPPLPEQPPGPASDRVGGERGGQRGPGEAQGVQQGHRVGLQRGLPAGVRALPQGSQQQWPNGLHSSPGIGSMRRGEPGTELVQQSREGPSQAAATNVTI